jgi:hypothetical protein
MKDALIPLQDILREIAFLQSIRMVSMPTLREREFPRLQIISSASRVATFVW